MSVARARAIQKAQARAQQTCRSALSGCSAFPRDALESRRGCILRFARTQGRTHKGGASWTRTCPLHKRERNRHAVARCQAAARFHETRLNQEEAACLASLARKDARTRAGLDGRSHGELHTKIRTMSFSEILGDFSVFVAIRLTLKTH